MNGFICESMRASACMRWLGSMTMRRISPARVPRICTSEPCDSPDIPSSGNTMRSVSDVWNHSFRRPALISAPMNSTTQSRTTAPTAWLNW